MCEAPGFVSVCRLFKWPSYQHQSMNILSFTFFADEEEFLLFYRFACILVDFFYDRYHGIILEV